MQDKAKAVLRGKFSLKCSNFLKWKKKREKTTKAFKFRFQKKKNIQRK